VRSHEITIHAIKKQESYDKYILSNRIYVPQVQNERESFPPPKLAPSFKVRGKNVAKMYVLSVPFSVPDLVKSI
jgi:hypothetical protein